MLLPITQFSLLFAIWILLFDQLSVNHVGTEGKNWINGMLMEPQTIIVTPPPYPKAYRHCLSLTVQFSKQSQSSDSFDIHTSDFWEVEEKTDKALNKEN